LGENVFNVRILKKLVNLVKVRGIAFQSLQ